jgi:hypothetical protein
MSYLLRARLDLEVWPSKGLFKVVLSPSQRKRHREWRGVVQSTHWPLLASRDAFSNGYHHMLKNPSASLSHTLAHTHTHTHTHECTHS